MVSASKAGSEENGSTTGQKGVTREQVGGGKKDDTGRKGGHESHKGYWLGNSGRK